MEVLQAMFPEVEVDVVSIVLESNGGNVERAIDQLLSISNTIEEPATVKTPLPSVDARSNITLKQPWRKPLPDDFLRVPPGLIAQRRDRHQIDEDALLARMLANEGFRRELRQHQEFESQVADGSFEFSWNDLSQAAKTKFNALATKFQRHEYASVGQDDMNALFPSDGASFASPTVKETELSDMTRMKIN